MIHLLEWKKKRQDERRAREAAVRILRELSQSWENTANNLAQVARDVGVDDDVSPLRDEARRCERMAAQLEKRGKIG